MNGWRKQFIEVAGVVVGAATLVNCLLGAYVAKSVSVAEDRAALATRIQILELEVAARKIYDETHETKTAPLIEQHGEMYREWPHLMKLVEEMHYFLVRRFQMPTALRKPAEPYQGPGLYAAEPPDPKGDAP